jgi:hypothetical protein
MGQNPLAFWSIAQPAEHDHDVDSETLVYVDVKGVRICVSLIGSDVHRLEALLAELLNGWGLQSPRLASQCH